MGGLKTSGFIVVIATAAIWGGLYYTGGSSTLGNVALLLGGILAATLFTMDWAEDYTP